MKIKLSPKLKKLRFKNEKENFRNKINKGIV